jgi:hypothetical protein
MDIDSTQLGSARGLSFSFSAAALALALMGYAAMGQGLVHAGPRHAACGELDTVEPQLAFASDRLREIHAAASQGQPTD